jgi:adenylate cyclase
MEPLKESSFSLPNNPSKWPRKLHAQLIDYLHSQHAAVIAMDIFFKDARITKTDQQLADAINKSNNVVLFTHLKRELLNQFGTTPRTQSTELFNVERLIHPTPVIASAASALAPFALPKYPAKVSKFWTFRIPAGEIATMPVVTLQLLLLKQKSFNNNLIILEKDNNIKFPVIKAQLQNKAKLNISSFISDMKDWSKQHQITVNKIASKINNNEYDSYITKKDKTALLQFFNLYNGNNQRHLNFFGPPRSITTFTVDAVLNKQLPNGFSFKNKIVFIGFSERLQPEQLDNFNTVFSQKNGVDLSGVEIAATAFTNLYNINSVTTLGYPGYLILVALFGFFVAFIARSLSNILALLTLVAISIGYFGISYYLFSVYSVWLPIIIPIFLLVPISLFSSISWQFFETNTERKRIRKAFGFYLPDNVVNDLAKKKGNIQNSQHIMYGICMATDAEQYTSLSEKLEPTGLSQLINKYYEVLFKPVRHHDGIISDVVGDAMLAIWTGHNPDIKLRLNACNTSIQIQQNLKQLQQINTNYALETRIGLHSGNIVMGHVGAVDHFEYRAVGDIVNTANRIQGLNKHLKTKIIASYETIQNIPNLLTRELGQFKLVGKTRAINLYEIFDFNNTKTNHDELISLYSLALQSFYEGKLTKSLKQFLQLNEQFPSDGATQFYITYIEALIKSKNYVKTDWTGSVTLDYK